MGRSGTIRTKLLRRIEKFEEVDAEVQEQRKTGKEERGGSEKRVLTDEKGWELGPGRAREKYLRMGTAKRLFNIGMSNVQLDMVCYS